MATFQRREICSSLTSKGFSLDTSTGPHDELAFQDTEKKDPLKTEVPRGAGSKDIGSPLLQMMRKDLHLERDQFHGLIECTVEEEDLRNIYRQEGYLPARTPTVKRVLSDEICEKAVQKIEGILSSNDYEDDPRLYKLYGIFNAKNATKGHLEKLNTVIEELDE
jgi:hypothetical protein